MDALLTSVPWPGLGWGGLIFLVILGFIRGDIVTRREHEGAIRLRENSVRRERAIADQAMSALRVLATEHGTTADKVLSALPVAPDDEEGAS